MTLCEVDLVKFMASMIGVLALQVMQRLRGDLPLPWEGELSPDVRRSLGAFQWPILKLLQRGPLERMTMRDFQHACTEYFAMHTTINA